MPENISIRRAENTPRVIEALADVLQDCVEGGASVSFMLPLARGKAIAFWEGVLANAAQGDRAGPENQPHRADVAKMLVHRRARRRGVGGLLLRGAEAAAREAGKTLLVLDTVTGADGDRLYARHGWQRVGVIPNYALWPQGGLCSTTVYYRDLSV